MPSFFIDVYGVTQPAATEMNVVNSKIWIGLDDDNLPENGIKFHSEILDLLPTTSAISILTI
jgi:hypothetical protein